MYFTYKESSINLLRIYQNSILQYRVIKSASSLLWSSERRPPVMNRNRVNTSGFSVTTVMKHFYEPYKGKAIFVGSLD